MTIHTLCVFGTRPEAIKMAPLIKQLEINQNICSKVCVTGQHQQMLQSVLDQFEIVPDFNLQVMTTNQDLSDLTAKILLRLAEVFKQYKPNLVLVHGDTTTTLAASLSAYYHHIPVAHVEAGLRTGDLNSPWPEEANRKLVSALAVAHFAPTERSRSNLIQEGIASETIHVVGNTVIDALQEMVAKIESQPKFAYELKQKFPFLRDERKLLLVTGHRRENFGKGFERICQALAKIARLFPEVDVVYPVHLNPRVQQPVKSLLENIDNIYLIEPVDYPLFVYLMKSAYLILTDSGGIQEEAPSLGKPILVMRDVTERPEAIEAGTVKLVGTDVEKIVINVKELLTDTKLYQQMSHAQNPYGDGQASARIVQIISQLKTRDRNASSIHSLTPVENITGYMEETLLC
ncbi:non-hydrolyzing UDP-N-acetylglucosamine 2-epimerase [Legionella lansingensis]|nr:UDP-N-acetylglucosamine 2-epimerase (non-hydrolyzing) [Legionella lansingensis]